MAAVDPRVWWYTSRATGIVAYALLAASVVWGLLISTKTLSRSTPPAWLLALHRHLGGLAVVFVGVHMAVLTLDHFAPFDVRDLLVPMASTWRPGPVAWGIVAFYLLIAVEVTSLLGRRFPKRWWRRVHLVSFLVFVLATVHLLLAGTERSNPLLLLTVTVVATVVVFLVVVRMLARYAPRAAPSDRLAAVRAAREPRAPDAAVESAPDVDAPVAVTGRRP